MLSAAAALTAGSAGAVTIDIIYTDGAGEGFNDPTLGAQRKAAFENAVGIWANQLQGSVAISVQAHFDPMGGTATAATLAAAGPMSINRDFPGAPHAGTWYPISLANTLQGSDAAPGQADIDVVCNSDVDNSTVLGTVDFYYGLDGNSGSDADFRTTVLHELGHGLGFVDMINSATGEFFKVDSTDTPRPDIYSRQLAQSPDSNPASKTDLTAMTDSQRLSAITSNQLYWKGSQVLSVRSNAMVKMYAPSPYVSGSSVSHWDTTNSPDLLMEPILTGAKSDVDLTREAFLDLGYTFVTNSVVDEWSLYE